MSDGLLTVLGGIGLFLFGMKILTDSLRDAAGPGLRHALTRFTGTPLRGAMTGAAATALIQSSSATTVMTVGFVGAGLIGFPQSLGVLYGANVGTTVTGWIVTFLGIKLKIGVLAQPVLFVAALTLLLGHGRMTRVARGVIGMCLLFIGLDLMQGVAALAQGWLSPDRLPGDTMAGRLMLIGIGFALVAVVQSSSAGMAITLVLLAGGALTFAQAAALVIGLNLGTTLTALLASLGGRRAMRQTALANTLFNLGTAVLAFPMLGLLAPLLHRPGGDDLTALVLFHTGFNLVGALIFLPLTARFAALVMWLIPDEDDGLTRALDPLLRSEPEAALTAAEATATAMQRLAFNAVAAALGPQADLRPLATLTPRLGPAQDRLEDYLAQLRLPDGRRDLQDRLTALLHRMDHLQRLGARLERRAPLSVIAGNARLRRAARALAGRLRSADTTAAQLARLASLIERRALIYRDLTLHQRIMGERVQDLFDRTDAVRWMARIARHAASIAGHAAP